MSAKARWLYLSLGVVIIGVMLAGLFVPQRQMALPAGQGTEKAAADLGFTYLPITSRVSVRELGVDSGVLVTEVVRDSPVDRAGIRTGDIIMSYNGKKLDGETPLLGILRDCPAGSQITLEVCRGDVTRVVKVQHMGMMGR